MSNIPPGSYQETSRDISVEGTPRETDCYLIATCRTLSGQRVESKLKYDIANCEGELKCAPNRCDLLSMRT